MSKGIRISLDRVAHKPQRDRPSSLHISLTKRPLARDRPRLGGMSGFLGTFPECRVSYSLRHVNIQKEGSL